MIKNYLKIAWRNLLHNKKLSFINIFGLATGMAFALLIGAWIKHETSYNDFHERGDRIAMIMKHVQFNDRKSTQELTPLPLYDELKNNYPEVRRASRMSFPGYISLINGDRKLNKEGRYVDPEFLSMFSFPVVKGNAATALKEPNSIVLTESAATALFGNEDPIGKMVKENNQFNLQVTAVIKDVPGNSTLTFDYLAPYEYQLLHDDFKRSSRTDWGNNFMVNLVELNEGASMEALSAKIAQLNVQKDKRIKNQELFLHPLRKWHLYGDFKNWENVGGKITYVRLFGVIGLFVLLIACINFMNLTTARSEKRAKEVGIRKAIGSKRGQLITQFLSESVLTAFLAFLLSIGLIYALLPYLKDLGFGNIRFDTGSLSLLAGGLVICAVTGLIAGSYPALYLSSFIPVSVLKGGIKQGKAAATFRKVLVTSQFVISIGLIIGTVIVYEQVQHAKERSLGYNPDNLVSVAGTPGLNNNFVPLKQELLNTGYLESVAKASQPLTAVYNKWSDFSWDGKATEQDISFDAVMTEWDFEKTAGLKFIAGRPFSRQYSTDSNAVILNEAAVKVMGYSNPVGRTMKSGNRTVTIIGIVENVLMEDPFKPISPLAILFNPYITNNIFLRLKPSADLQQTLATVQPVFEKYNPSMPFEYSFVNEEFGRKFSAENQAGKLAGIFAVLAIFISCMGLLGLSMFMAERRTKEIGIRKVLGASVTNLWLLLSKEFIGLVLLACVIASPLAFWIMKSWLQNYEYRIHIGWWVFAGAGSLVILLALLTVSTQTVRAAGTNPVKNLRAE